ncbi:hypothetical protein Gotri_009906 [Gossypium trilobum]|uniref:Uncharacterized protein n=5 Tax=Gossypium TaxID=3633 RepID=A0A7J9JQD0_9ROSI|nr:hypothetical protein [Gossypium raimondii]MBA0691057.1 hypothetical protein [Gossypium aridum]MBA0774715.1 hypothetical protein [Gossypium trilobum]MBA0807509.1 hypothetical protein [Gossypium harknessii]MBA0836383.1 hypothetical protein [Gossypium armourianum]
MHMEGLEQQLLYTLLPYWST